VLTEPSALRDDLLKIARAAVRSAERRGTDPLLVGEVIVDAWLDALPRIALVDRNAPAAPGTVSADHGFTAEPSRGVEALAFVVAGSLGGLAAGIILRLPDEYPDSFEQVATSQSRLGTAAAIRAAFWLMPG
jgi:hypothetical protein